MLEVKNVSKKFFHPDGDILALDNINLSIAEHELTTIVGPSGCGKTTLLNCLAGFVVVDDGVISLDGKPINYDSSPVGYMSQDDGLLPWSTLEDNIALPLKLGKNNNKELIHKRVHELINIFGLAGFENHLPASLSSGIRQRVALARTYLTQKDILLLDEPFGKMDAFTRLELQEWFLSIWELERKTVVMVTHDIDEAILLSDQIYVLSPRPGKIAFKIKVDIPRPRHFSITTSPEFMNIKKLLLHSLHVM
jgi:ABC-type nitrate/sulfonate/bicarbonate transport system ATPase subunit